MRTLVKVLVAVSCVMLVAGSSFAKVSGDILEFPNTTVKPVIDGKFDAVWKTLDDNFQQHYTNGSMPPDGLFDLMGYSRIMWDKDFIYGFMYTQDDIIIDEHANVYERDGWEVYFDADNSKGTTAANGTDYDGVNDIQIRMNHGDGTDVTAISTGMPVAWASGEFWASSAWDRAAAGVKVAVGDTTQGFIIEWQFPMESLYLDPTPGTIIGFEQQQNDNDGTARESISKWWVAEGDPSWNNAACWGTAVLSGRKVGEEYVIGKTAEAPVIDGEKDAAWATYAVPLNLNTYCNGSMEPTDYDDLSFTGTLMFDNANMYGLAEINDDIIIDEHANVYERDGVETYYDADNSKGTTAANGTDYDGVNDIQIRTNHGDGTDVTAISTGMPVAWASGEFWASSAWDRAAAGVKVAVKDTDKGYNIEWQFPLESLYIDPTDGQVIGTEFQVNDNDGTARESIAKWWVESGDPSWNNAATWGTAVLKNSLEAVKEKSVSGPARYDLAQNYPNPFNPTTTISYSLKSSGKVRLSVFDIMGKEVAVLVDGSRAAGNYDVQFNASNLTSGMYFYKLQTADQMFTKKMTLVK